METIIDFFDPKNIEHMQAFEYFQKNLEWPKTFLPEEKLENPKFFPRSWKFSILNKISNHWLEEIKIKHPTNSKEDCLKTFEDMQDSTRNGNLTSALIKYLKLVRDDRIKGQNLYFECKPSEDLEKILLSVFSSNCITEQSYIGFSFNKCWVSCKEKSIENKPTIFTIHIEHMDIEQL